MNTYVLLIFRCSEQSLNLDDLRELLPSRCTLGLAFCQGTCHAIGRRDGKCQYGEVQNVLISTKKYIFGIKRAKYKSSFPS